ncbi:hypothetical protein [Ectothiorhodospira variabilis]|uniref:hypothetical protein n=1 Tax=Ectothiorhodospira variabilis TaxID=505694 RepID=UPI001EFA7F66|nr:hypothetical protein [Ectothiorhodospira variabilis]MCG5495109.1 hypothetical protein [Ectothiorhodospira variabilis]MCG5503803.1 hypothetical protein [Ectothiorhodospira variabilis]MCG5507066.1 hypothetical protein [Ectothiorhodospira variabilis]
MSAKSESLMRLVALTRGSEEVGPLLADYVQRKYHVKDISSFISGDVEGVDDKEALYEQWAQWIENGELDRFVIDEPPEGNDDADDSQPFQDPEEALLDMVGSEPERRSAPTPLHPGMIPEAAPEPEPTPDPEPVPEPEPTPNPEPTPEPEPTMTQQDPQEEAHMAAEPENTPPSESLAEARAPTGSLDAMVASMISDRLEALPPPESPISEERIREIVREEVRSMLRNMLS